MGYFGYRFISLTPLQVADRRIQLDLHAFVAQASLGLVLVVAQLLRLLDWTLRRHFTGDVESRPSSPQKKYIGDGGAGGWGGKMTTMGRALRWWMGEEVELPLLSGTYGVKGQWVGGLAWASWLAVLCFHETAPDYMHFTKRFGIIAASQLPVHYLLTLRSPYSPLQLLFRASHESLNAAHRVLGKIIVVLLSLHATFYLNFFIRNGLLATRILHRDVIIGLTCITIVLTLGSTAMTIVRRQNYRLFYTIHAIGGSLPLPLLFFHVPHVRPFVLECGFIRILDLSLRLWNTKSYPGSTLTMVKGTQDLIQISIPLSSNTAHRNWKPGMYVYLRSPAHHSKAMSYLRSNPLTISSLPATDAHITLVARALNGTTRRLASSLHHQNAPSSSSLPPQTLALEGPYGLPTAPDHFSRILFLAGGIGATYILPLWRHAALLSPPAQDRRLVWVVRTAADTAWALPALAATRRRRPTGSDDMELYVTRAAAAPDIELTDLGADGQATEQATAASAGFVVHTGARPSLRGVVDEVLGSGKDGRAAVIVCGPPGMGRAARKEVARWVRRGRDVYFHAEEFGL